jgi:hypothetical protein
VPRKFSKSSRLVAAFLVTNAIAAASFAQGSAATRPTSATTRATTGPATAADAVRAYVSLFKQHRPMDAFREMWDWDFFMDEAFGPRYREMSKPDRDAAVQLLMSYLAPVMAHEKLVKVMAESEYSDFTTIPKGEDRATVRLVSEHPAHRARSWMYCRRTDSGWKIFDQENSGRPSLAAELRAGYRKLEHRMSPLDFVKGMKAEADEIAARAKATSAPSKP